MSLQVAFRSLYMDETENYFIKVIVSESSSIVHLTISKKDSPLTDCNILELNEPLDLEIVKIGDVLEKAIPEIEKISHWTLSTIPIDSSNIKLLRSKVSSKTFSGLRLYYLLNIILQQIENHNSSMRLRENEANLKKLESDFQKTQDKSDEKIKNLENTISKFQTEESEKIAQANKIAIDAENKAEEALKKAKCCIL